MHDFTALPWPAPPPAADVCALNVIASHPGVIGVAAADRRDQPAPFSSRNSPCIDVWAPSGGLGGGGLVGASGTGPSNYSRANSLGWGAAGVATGVAAQFLQLNPTANATELRRALTQLMPVPAVVGAGPASTTALLVTNLTQTRTAAAAAGADGGGGEISTGAVVGISMAGCAGEWRPAGSEWCKISLRCAFCTAFALAGARATQLTCARLLPPPGAALLAAAAGLAWFVRRTRRLEAAASVSPSLLGSGA